MLSYIIRRMLIMIPMLLIISLTVFFLIQLPPGDFLDSYVAQLESQGETVARDQIKNLEIRYGLNQPKYIQYLKWISGFPRGDFGGSFTYEGKGVWSVIKVYLGFTVLVTLATQLFTLFVGIPIGIYSATHKYTLGDHLVTFVGFIGLAIPNFLLALILMFVSYSYFDIPTLGGLFSEQYIDAPWSLAKIIDLIMHLWIPIIVLGTAGTASTIRIMRANLLDVLNLQYINTARAKGLKESLVIYKHAVRNAVHPIIMMIGMQLPKLLSGATIVSIVLSLPTLGPVLFRALTTQDMYLAGSILFFQCLLLMTGNLLADVVLVIIDPRVQFN